MMQNGDSPAQENSPGTWKRPVINILGEKVALGPYDKGIVETYHRWVNDFDTLRLGGLPIKPRTLEQQIASFERWGTESDEVWFLMYEVATWRPVGWTGIQHIDLHHRSAEFGITIAEPDARGRGYGTEAAQLVLDYAFTACGLHSVYLTTAAYNIAGQRAYKKAGFREAGRLRESDFMGGKFWDLIYMDCLATEFTSPVLARTFLPEEPGA
ncbi:MAG: GNAT family N-acetyltransferase [Chloroflexota bacterium]|nr:GNAT family N-acetyltransferase [Chloroflexota bacterium]